MQRVSDDVQISEVFEGCGHSLSLEQPERLATLIKKFITGNSQPEVFRYVPGE